MGGLQRPSYKIKSCARSVVGGPIIGGADGENHNELADAGPLCLQMNKFLHRPYNVQLYSLFQLFTLLHVSDCGRARIQYIDTLAAERWVAATKAREFYISGERIQRFT